MDYFCLQNGIDNMREDQMLCPQCQTLLECDSVDVGVGLVVRGNFTCDCGWEIDGPDDFGFVDTDELEFADRTDET